LIKKKVGKKRKAKKNIRGVGNGKGSRRIGATGDNVKLKSLPGLVKDTPGGGGSVEGAVIGGVGRDRAGGERWEKQGGRDLVVVGRIDGGGG